MPRVPEYFQPDPVGASGELNYQRINADPQMFGAGVGVALQRAGAEIGSSFDQLAADYTRDVLQTARFQDQAALSNFEGEESKRLQQAADNTTDAAFGFTNKFIDEQRKAQEALFAGKPQLEQARLKAQLAEMNAQFSTRAYAIEQKKRFEYNNTELQKQWDTQGNGVIDKPTAIQFYKDRMYHLIDSSSLAEDDKKTWKEKVDKEAPLFYEQGLRQTKAGAEHVVGALGGSTSFEKAVSQQESGGNPDIGKHRGSSAWGEFGITKDTWKRIASSDEGKAAGLSTDPDARKDPANNRIGFQILTKLNAKELQAAGFEANDKNLYLAHFAGPAGAIKLLRADPSQSAAAILPDAAASNPAVFYKDTGQEGDLKPRTVGEVIALQTRRFGGGVPSLAGSDPVLAQLPPEQRVRALAGAEQDLRRFESQDAATANKAQAEFTNDLAMRLLYGKATAADVDAAVGAGQITEANTVQYLKGIAAQQVQKQTTLEQAQAKFDSGAAWTPRDNEDKKFADALFREQVRVGGDPYGQGAAIAARTGMMPGAFTDWLMGQVTATNPKAVGQAMNFVTQWMGQNPNIFDGAQNSADLQKLGAIYQDEIDRSGDPQRATQKVMEAQNPEFLQKVRTSPDQVKAFREEITKGDQRQQIVSGFSHLFSVPSIAQPQLGGMMADFTEYATEHFQKYGDAAQAQKYAVQQMQRNYGVNDQGLLMKYPPEKYYATKIGGRSTWIYDQAAAAVKSVTGFEPKAGKVFLLPLRHQDAGISTAEEVMAGQKPHYGIVYMRPDGMFDTLSTVNGRTARFQPDANVAVAEDQRLPTNPIRKAITEQLGTIGAQIDQSKTQNPFKPFIRGIINREPQQ